MNNDFCNVNKLLSYALKLLSKRAYSPKEIEEKLKKKCKKYEVVEETLEILYTKFFPKETLEQMYLEALFDGMIRKLKGPKIFAYKAQIAGISYEKIQHYIEKEEWEVVKEKVIHLSKKRFPNNPQKQKQFIYRRGF